MPERTTCAVDGCDRTDLTRDWCGMHYQRMRAHGTPLKRSRPANGECMRFLEVAALSDTDQCLLWPFGVNEKGYGRLSSGGKTLRASRVVLHLAVGPPPTDRHVAAHTPDICHNPRCVNPKHLRWATPKSNSADKVIDGTQARGEQTPPAKLTDDEAAQIKARALAGENQRALAEEFRISQSAVSSIKLGKTRRHLG